MTSVYRTVVLCSKNLYPRKHISSYAPGGFVRTQRTCPGSVTVIDMDVRVKEVDDGWHVVEMDVRIAGVRRVSRD